MNESRGESGGNGDLRAGAAVTDLTPEGSVFLFGYPHVPRLSTGVHDRLQCSALYVEGGGGRVLFLANDLIFVGRKLAGEVRRRIADLQDSREPVLVAGIVSDMRIINGNRGKVAIFKLDDKTDVIESVAGPPVPLDVLDAMAERRDLGIRRYRTPLQYDNGRDPWIDAAQEALDLVSGVGIEIPGGFICENDLGAAQ